MKPRKSSTRISGHRSLAILFLGVMFLAVPLARAQFPQGTAGGTALAFDGVSGYVTISNSPALNVYPLTVMGWFRTSDQGIDRGLINKYIAGSLSGYQIYLYQGHLRAWYFRDAANYVWDGDLGLDGGFVAGLWLHVAFTVDASGGKLYVNGALRASRAWTGTPGVTTQAQDMQFGRYANNFFNGELDEVSVWNVALSSDAIISAMNRRLETNEPGLLAYWRFEEGLGTVTADAVPALAGKNTGKLLGGVSWEISGAVVGPLVNTKGISGQTISGEVDLNGEINPLGRATTAWFEWGTNLNYGNLTTPLSVGAGSNYLTAGALISGLQQGHTYHYRCVATNLNGRANGSDQSFIQPVYPSAAGGPPLRSSAYDGGYASFVAYDPRPEWDAAVEMTIEAWVYRQDATRYETIVSHDWPGSYWFGFSPLLRFYRGTNYVEIPTPVPAWKWTHVAVSYDGTIARFYINGDYVGARAVSNTGAAKVRELLIGHDDTHNSDIGPREQFLGNLDEIRLWSVARSAEEIRGGMYAEIRGEPGLAAAFPRGGRFEDVISLVGAAGSGVSEQIVGMVPRDLVVPRAAIPPVADGTINLASEYLGAEQLVLRYPEQPATPDAVAYFIHTDDDLFVATTVIYKDPIQGLPTNSWLSLFIDTTNGRPALAEYPQVQLLTYMDDNTNHSAWLNGDGGGSYYACFTPPGLGLPRPCTPRVLWQVGKRYCNGEINPDLCTEFRISKLLLGDWNQYDGVALGHFNFTPFADQAFVPEDGYPDSPATWLTMSYGEGSANLPRVQWSGHVYASLTASAPFAGHRVSLFAGGAAYSQFTDFLGRFNFDVPMPTGVVIYAEVDNVAFARYRLPNVSTVGYQPQYVFMNDVRYPGLPPSLTGTITLASVDYFIQNPLPASGITSADPASPVVGFSGRVGVQGGTGGSVKIYGSNLHDQVEFYLSPATTFINPPQWTLLRATVLQIAPDRSWVKVQLPYVPDRVPIYQGGYLVDSYQADWRWVSWDKWTRPNMITFTYFGNFKVQLPPYPLVHGFDFHNTGAAPSLDEFFACFGYNAYYCVGAFGYCATHVPNPLYVGIWYPVYYEVIKSSGGSCVGMSSTSLQIYDGYLNAGDFDPLAITAIGIDDPGFPGHWDTSNTGGKWTRPPIPLDVWARIRMNHGAQTSAEFFFQAISELDISVFNLSFGGNPVARLNNIRANPTASVVSMVPGVGGGHCVMPYRVEDNFGGDPNLSRIYIYDNNHECGRMDSADADCVTNRFIDINLSDNTYSFPDFNWSGSGFFVIPVNIFNQERHMPGISDVAEDLALLLLIVVGGADGHYTSSDGEWGWRADGTFVDNLPGLKSMTPIGSPYNHTRSVPVLLPISNNIPVIDINVRDTNRHVFHAAHHGTLMQVETPADLAGASHQVRLGVLSNELSSFHFTPQQAVSNFIPKIGFTLGSNASATFQWMGLTGDGGKTHEFRALKSRRAVEYCNHTGRATQHYLRIEAVDGASSNVTCSVFGPFNVPTGAVHCVVLHDWPRVQQVRSELDLDGDGIPDQVTMVDGAAVDSDGDGMPDAWELAHQMDPQSALCDDGPDADPDHDGVSNYDEYLTGTDPHDPKSVLRLTAAYLPGGKVRLSWPAVPGRRYEVQFANTFEYTFQTLPGAGFPRVATSTDEHFDDALPTGPTRTRFYRVRLVP